MKLWQSGEFVVETLDDPSDNALIAVWVIEAELDSSRQNRLDCSRRTDARRPPPLLVTSDQAAADQPFFHAPPA